jgi:hypothetical protein
VLRAAHKYFVLYVRGVDVSQLILLYMYTLQYSMCTQYSTSVTKLMYCKFRYGMVFVVHVYIIYTYILGRSIITILSGKAVNYSVNCVDNPFSCF